MWQQLFQSVPVPIVILLLCARCRSNSARCREPWKLIMYIDADYKFSWLEHNFRTCWKKRISIVMVWFRLDVFLPQYVCIWFVCVSQRNLNHRKTKVETVKLVLSIFSIRSDCIITYAVTKDCLLFHVIFRRVYATLFPIRFYYFARFFLFSGEINMTIKWAYDRWFSYKWNVQMMLSTELNMLQRDRFIFI